MRADEAKKIARAARQQQERARAKEAAAAAVWAQQEGVRKAAPIIRELTRLIKPAAARGDPAIHQEYANDGMWRALSIVAEHFRKLGYKTEYDHGSREMGDSAAPCQDNYTYITISWGHAD